MTLLRRLNREKPTTWPYHFVEVVPARWPAKDWQRRRRYAQLVSTVVRMVQSLLDTMLDPIRALAVDIEGQPLGIIEVQPGWRTFYRTQKPGWVWVYDGPITPELRAMFAEHPERFADCAPALLSTLRLGQ